MNPTAKVQVGKTRLHVTRLGLGGAALGGLFQDSTEEVATGTIRRALELGINLFDTAPLYGAGKSESRMGRGLANVDRDSFVLASKIGYALVPESEAGKDVYFPFENPPALRPVVDFSYDGAMRSFEESLKRLGLSRIDILHIHDPEGHVDEVMKGVYIAADKLRRDGVIRAVSIGTNDPGVIVSLVKAGHFDCCLLANRYTLLDHSALQEALPVCLSESVSVIIGGPYNSGILATGAVPGALYYYRPAEPEIMARVRTIEDVCREYEVPLKAAALQFPLAHPAVATIIPGARSEHEISENFDLVSADIPYEFWVELRRRGLVPEDAPLPSDSESMKNVSRTAVK